MSYLFKSAQDDNIQLSGKCSRQFIIAQDIKKKIINKNLQKEL